MQLINLLHRYPVIAKEWHPTKNGELTPSEVAPKSHKKVWWLCEKGHEWPAIIKNRTSRNDSCPFCSGKKLTKTNNLSYKYPELTKEWHPLKNESLKATDVFPKSNKFAWWKCSKGHEWRAKICNRANGRGCPYCGNKIINQENNFAANQPDLLLEWDFDKNKSVSPDEIFPNSRKQVWWKCKYGHEWKAWVYSRVGKNSDCPLCSGQTSKLEVSIYCELKIIFTDIQWRSKFYGHEIDIYIPQYKVGVEVDGYYWHKDKFELDVKKHNNLSKKGINLIHIREGGLPNVTSTDIHIKKTENKLNVVTKTLMLLLDYVCDSEKTIINNYLNNNKLTNTKEYKKILSYLPGPLPESSLETMQPVITSEWCHEKNEPLLPSMFYPKSNKKVWWICDKKHPPYEASILNRVNGGTGCPYCAGKRTTPEYNLAFKHPRIANEWHPTLNGKLSAKDVTPSSGKKSLVDV